MAGLNEEMRLVVVDLPMEQVLPNPWNPNRQTERQFRAEVESILDNGFLLPIIVRPSLSGWEIIDGEHRLRAMREIVESGEKGVGNVPDLVGRGVIPAVVVDLDDARAKRLTVILNETRGRADTASLAALLAEIQPEFGDDLLVGLPYTGTELDGLLQMTDFDWDSVGAPSADDFERAEGPTDRRIVAVLSEEVGQAWDEAIKEEPDMPADAAKAAGVMIGRLLGLGS